MHNGLLIALVAGLGAMVGWGTADYFAKRTIDAIGDLRSLFWQQCLGIIPLVALFLASPHVPHLHHFDPLFLVLLGAVSGLSYLPLYNGFGKGQVSLLSPVFASYSVLVLLISVLFLGESLSGLQALAMVVVLTGILLLSTDLKDINRSFHKHAFKLAGLPEVASATLVYSVWLVFLDNFLDGKQWVFYMLCIRIFSTLSLAAYALARRISLKVSDRSLWKYLGLIGLFDVGAYSFVSYGFSHSDYLSIVVVLSAAFSVPTLILARLFLQERISRSQASAVAIIICGIVLISLG